MSETMEHDLIALAMEVYPHWSRSVIHSNATRVERRAELIAMGREALAERQRTGGENG